MDKTKIKPDYQKAQNAASSIIQYYSQFPDSIFPINPINIVKDITNIKIEKYSRLANLTESSITEICEMFNTDEGTTFYRERDNKYVISYNDVSKNEHRVKFTLAHELGHILLGHLLNEKSGLIYKRQEKEANYFAKRLLIPLCFLTKLREKTVLPSLSTSDIAFIFDSSEDVAKYSIDNYNNLWFTPKNDLFCQPFEKELNDRLAIIEMTHKLSTTA